MTEKPKTEKPRRRRPILTREDLKLWAHVAASTVPMKGKAVPEIAEEHAVPVPSPAAKSVKSVPATVVKPAKPDLLPLVVIERRLRQRLSRGQRDVDGVIDLHGMYQAQAHAALLRFITGSHLQGKSLVLVITGKGATGAMGAHDLEGERGILRRMVPHWLGDPSLRRHILGFEEASREHGGGGALYVRIRKARDRT